MFSPYNFNGMLHYPCYVIACFTSYLISYQQINIINKFVSPDFKYCEGLTSKAQKTRVEVSFSLVIFSYLAQKVGNFEIWAKHFFGNDVMYDY